MLPIQLVTVSNWVLIAVTIIGVVVVFDPFGNEHSDKSMNDKLWEKRFKCISPICCLQHHDANHGAFEDIARILTSQFEDVDLVASDVAVGLMLVAHKQQTASYKRHLANECSYEKKCSIYNFNSSAKRSAFKELTYYSVYAIGAYGWPLFMFIHPFTGCFNLCQECSIFNEAHEGDNLCHSNHLALKKLSGLEDNDILYAEFGSSVYCPAFYISVDHDKQAIILSIRGTLSLQDVITDMVCDPEPIPGYPGFQAHKGMVMSAKNILKIIEEKDLLTIAFQLYPDFSLVVLGHSLGAGTATLLSFILRPLYPSLKCFAYGPPGCLLCVNATEESKKFVMSTIINKEFSSRLSMKSLGELRENVLAAIRTNTRPKWKLTLSQLIHWNKPNQFDNLFDDAEECPLIVPTLGELENGLVEEETNLFPPGRIVFVHKNAPAIGEGDFISNACHFSHSPTDTTHVRRSTGHLQNVKCCSTDSSYEILEAPNNLFNTIEVSPEMLTDHLPDTLVTLLKDLQPLDVSAGDDI